MSLLTLINNLDACKECGSYPHVSSKWHLSFWIPAVRVTLFVGCPRCLIPQQASGRLASIKQVAWAVREHWNFAQRARAKLFLITDTGRYREISCVDLSLIEGD